MVLKNKTIVYTAVIALADEEMICLIMKFLLFDLGKSLNIIYHMTSRLGVK